MYCICLVSEIQIVFVCVCVTIKQMEMLVYMLQITEVVTLSATCGETYLFCILPSLLPPPPHLLPHNGPLLA
jgi:hypothetical protein